MDADGQQGRVAAYPYPIDENNVVLSFLPQGWRRDRKGHLIYRDHRAPFALYWTDAERVRWKSCVEKRRVGRTEGER